MSDAMMGRNTLDMGMTATLFDKTIERFNDQRDLHGTFAGYMQRKGIQDFNGLICSVNLLALENAGVISSCRPTFLES
jgi:hypothetical protein